MQRYRHIYLSPHLDDAVLSSGGRISQLVKTGEPVLVVTVFAGSPHYHVSTGQEPHSSYVAALHHRWQAEDDAPLIRQAEDRAALRVLGAGFWHLNYLDCIYRHHPLTGEFLYRSNEDIFGDVHPGEFSLAAELETALERVVGMRGEAVIYAPLAVGHHVDHQMVTAAALLLQASGHSVFFYEDYPYAEDHALVKTAMRRVSRENWRQEILSFDFSDLMAKTKAVLCYRSQLSTFFKSNKELALRLRAFALTCSSQKGPCERIWHLTK